MTSPRPDTVSLSEVAQLAGVRPSAVSNWRSRSADFPMPVDGTRYLRAEIETWLRQHNKDVRVSRSTADGGQLLWHSADALRAMAPVEEILVLLLQILTLRATAGTTREATLWPTLLREPSGLSDALVELGPRLAPDDHFWRSALEPSAFARHIPPSAALSVLRAVDDLPRNSDWARVALEIVSGFPTRFGMRGAESFTPTGLGAVLLAMAGPVRGTVYDPASGTGSLLAMAAEAAGAADVRLYGQDIGVYAHRLSQLLLRLRSTPAELALGDTLVDDRFADVRADLVLAQPPINLRIPYRDALQFDARWAWGIPNGTADWLWAQHAYSHLAQGGVAVIVLSAGPLFRDADAQIRRRMLEDDALEAVVQLPHAMTPETSVHMVALVLRRGARPNRGRVLFADLSKRGARTRGGLTDLAADELRSLATMLRDWRGGRRVSRPGVAGVVSVGDLLAEGGNLLPSNHIEAERSVDSTVVAVEARRVRADLERQLATFPAVAQDLRRRLDRFEEPQ
jgi:hypothetical protein